MERIRAPEVNAGLGWLNTDRPLRMGEELRGRVVVLDFWTYCCINCMHILPDLAFLEEKYAGEPVVFLGVHSAKFANEASRETIRAAIHRYEIRHPVVIDDDMRIWRSYAVRSWPTVVVIDPAGYVVGAFAGEGNRAALEQAIGETLRQGRFARTLTDQPLGIQRESEVRAASGLAFPGKIFAEAGLKRLFVADSNHNRVVIAELPDESGVSRVVAVVGTGEVGAADGPADRATFNHPQGLATGHGNLYVADTENHLIRQIHLESLEVTTIVGTGQMVYDRAGGGRGTQQGLNSPWDLAIEGSTMYVAMAGEHQIWRIDLPVAFARAFAGNGRENLADGPTETAALAQPSGICLLNGTIYFADSEVSAIRGIDMANERVFTVIGEGLFSFGDVDGVHPQAKLQHPLGVAAWKNSLLVADTYNHKLKIVDPGARAARTAFGTGRAGTTAPDGGAAFFEPGGVSVVGDFVFVADTNNHRVIRVHLVTGKWHEITFEGLESPRRGHGVGEVNLARPVSVAAHKDVEIGVAVGLPPGAHLSPEAPWSIRVSSGGISLTQRTGRTDRWPLTITVPASSVRNSAAWTVDASFAYCFDGGGLCVPKNVTWSFDVASGGATSRIELEAQASPE